MSPRRTLPEWKRCSAPASCGPKLVMSKFPVRRNSGVDLRHDVVNSHLLEIVQESCTFWNIGTNRCVFTWAPACGKETESEDLPLFSVLSGMVGPPGFSVGLKAAGAPRDQRGSGVD